MVVYIKVTDDEYEFPVAIADTVAELARIVGTNEKTIRSAISHHKAGRRHFCIYRAVDIGNEEDPIDE